MMMVLRLFYKILLIFVLTGIVNAQDSVKTMFDYPVRTTILDTDGLFGFSIGRDYYRFRTDSLAAYVEGKIDLTPYVPKSTTLTLSGTTNQITITGGTQNLGTDRSWTVSLPSYVLIGTAFDVTATTNSYRIGNTGVLGLTTLGSTVVNSSLTSVGALESGSIVSGFGSININKNKFTGGNIALDSVGAWNTVYGNIGFFGATSIGNRLFVSGYFGNGWRIWRDSDFTSFMEIDNVVIRNSLRTSVFQKDVVRASNGYLFISDASTIVRESSTSDSPKYIFVKENNFSSGDLLWYKDIDTTGGTITGIKITLTSNDTLVTVTDSTTQQAYRYTYTVSSGSGTFEAGGSIVRVNGSSIYMDASSGNAPFIDLYSGVTSWANFQDPTKVVARIGNLGGLSNFAGTTIDSTTYGAYFRDNVFIGSLSSGSGIQLSTDATGGVYDTGFMLYDVSNPKLFVGVNGGASLDWNITTANALTLKNARLTSPLISTAATGARVELDSTVVSGGYGRYIRFFGSSGSDYAYIGSSESDPDDIIIESTTGSNNILFEVNGNITAGNLFRGELQWLELNSTPVTTGTTIDVANKSYLILTYPSITTITNFTNGVAGQRLLITRDAGSIVTIDHNANVNLAGSADFVFGDEDVLELLYNGANWVEITRSDN